MCFEWNFIIFCIEAAFHLQFKSVASIVRHVCLICLSASTFKESYRLCVCVCVCVCPFLCGCVPVCVCLLFTLVPVKT